MSELSVDFDDAIPVKKLAHLLDTSEERLANETKPLLVASRNSARGTRS